LEGLRLGILTVRGARMGDMKGAYRILLGRPEGKRPLYRHKHRWEDNVVK